MIHLNKHAISIMIFNMIMIITLSVYDSNDHMLITCAAPQSSLIISTMMAKSGQLLASCSQPVNRSHKHLPQSIYQIHMASWTLAVISLLHSHYCKPK